MDVLLRTFHDATGQRSFACRRAKIWNELSDDLKSLTSVKAFKAHLIKHILNVNNVNLNIQF